MKTITLDNYMSFNDALQYLMDGKCIGIRPAGNSNYIERFKPKWMNQESPDWMLRWNNSEDNQGIRTNQYFEKWFPVIVDHRELGR